jgi:hypothetical protein
MSNVSELMLQLQADAHDMGDDFGFESSTIEQLASYYNVPKEFVEQALENNTYAEDGDDYDDSTDGDFDSAMASCGWGTDEAYCCGEEY